MPWFFWAFLAMAGWVWVRAAWAPVPSAARWDALKWAAVLGMGWAWTQLARERGAWRILLGGVFIAVSVECLYGVFQQVNGSRAVLWMTRPAQYGLRVSGTFLCPNHFANIVAMTVPVAVVVLLARGAGLPLRMLAGYCLAAAVPTLYGSLSRSAWLGVAGGLSVTALGIIWRRNRAWFLAGLVVAPLLLAGAGWVAWKALPGVRERMSQIRDNQGGDFGSGGRLKMWRDSLEMWKDRKTEGFGGGSFVWAFPKYQRESKLDLLYDYPHNEYVQTLLEYGAIGGGLLALAMLAWGIESLWALRQGREDDDFTDTRRADDRCGAALLAGAAGAAVAGGVHALFDFNFHIFPNPHVLVALAGIAWGAWRSERDAGADTGGARVLWIRRGTGLALAALWAFCGTAALRAGVSYWQWMRGEEARESVFWDEAAERFGRAVAWDGLNGDAWRGLGDVLASRSLLYRNPDPEARAAKKRQLADEALEAYEAALERNPLDALAVFGMGCARQAAGDEEGALECFLRASEMQPWHRDLATKVGMQLRVMGRTEEALEWTKRQRDEGRTTAANEQNRRWLEKRAKK
jgi:O-antigen ligase